MKGGKMAIKFLSEEWIQALMSELNNSEAYREAAKNWEGDFYFIVEPEDNTKERVIYYMDLWHGECRSACVIKDDK
jgi:putative sterol carrier protein